MGSVAIEAWQERGKRLLDLLAEDLGAVFAGRVEEGGRGDDRAVRLTRADGRTVRRGAIRCIPLPWSWRPRTRYSAYCPTAANSKT
jgi:hypothetical protein